MRVLSVDVGRRNMAMTIVDHRGIVSFTKQGLVEGTCQAIADFFADLPEFDAVVLERQPGQNVRMVRLQLYIEMLYFTQGIHVHVFDPRKRLEFSAKSAWWPPKTPFPKTYFKRKQGSARTCRIFLDKTNQKIREFDIAAKKDDLADCILQALAFFDATGALDIESESESGVDPRDGLETPPESA